MKISSIVLNPHGTAQLGKWARWGRIDVLGSGLSQGKSWELGESRR